jgi:hypothetical protein
MTHFYRSIYEPSEVLALSRPQRRFVYRNYIHPITVRMPVMLAKTAVWAVVLFAGWRLRAFESTIGFILVMLAAFAVGECFRVLLLLGNKGRIATIVREHAADIESAEPCAAPNGGPATSVDNSNAPGGPPSVS